MAGLYAGKEPKMTDTAKWRFVSRLVEHVAALTIAHYVIQLIALY